nr:uncharacterized protein LOC112723855 [Arachis hypogaea]
MLRSPNPLLHCLAAQPSHTYGLPSSHERNQNRSREGEREGSSQRRRRPCRVLLITRGKPVPPVSHRRASSSICLSPLGREQWTPLREKTRGWWSRTSVTANSPKLAREKKGKGRYLASSPACLGAVAASAPSPELDWLPSRETVKEGGRSRATVLAVGASMAVGSCRCPTSCNRGCLISCMVAGEAVVAAGTITRTSAVDSVFNPFSRVKFRLLRATIKAAAEPVRRPPLFGSSIPSSFR